MCTVRPYTIGLTTLPWTMLKMTVQMPITRTSIGVPAAIAMRKAAPVETKPPMYGMKHRKKDRTKTGSASGIPRTTMMNSWLAAPTSEIAPVPIM